MRSVVLTIVLLSALGGCHRRAADGDATVAVRQFFHFAEAGDCARLQPLMAKPDECENVVRQFAETKAHLVSIDESKVDGRDPKARLVYTTVAFGKRDDHKWILRAAQNDAGWKLRL